MVADTLDNIISQSTSTKNEKNRKAFLDQNKFEDPDNSTLPKIKMIAPIGLKEMRMLPLDSNPTLVPLHPKLKLKKIEVNTEQVETYTDITETARGTTAGEKTQRNARVNPYNL